MNLIYAGVLPFLIVAQAARVGRLPLLATPAAGARCTSMPITPELRSAGIARLLNVEEPTHPRLLTLGVTSTDKPLMLMAMMSTRQERRSEGENRSEITRACTAAALSPMILYTRKQLKQS